MALYLLKPILWNTRSYLAPSGVRAAPKSFPGQYGFGHEEWNNSPRLSFAEGGQRYRAFHTESVKNAPVLEHAGQTFVFMTASHDGVQQLVGIAGHAQYLGDPQDVEERSRLAKLLKLDALGKSAWDQPLVRKRFNSKEASFRKVWDRDISWIPNWICPEEFYWWLDEPVTLKALQITGKKALPKMFSGYMPLELSSAEVIMSMIPGEKRGPAWGRLVDAMRIAPTESIPSEAIGHGLGKSTTRLSLAQARIGQGKYRQDLLQKWGHTCAVSGLTTSSVLRASHVKPWNRSSDTERLDPENGLLLSANLDALFDVGLISFADDGQMLIAKELESVERARLGLPGKLRIQPTMALRRYLKHHRTQLFAKYDAH